MDAARQEFVRRRALFRCEYCLLPEALVSTPFQFDHIIAQSHGGETTADNLAFACFHCNNFKGPNVAGIDPDTGEIVRLFHPHLPYSRASRVPAGSDHAHEHVVLGESSCQPVSIQHCNTAPPLVLESGYGLCDRVAPFPRWKPRSTWI